MDTGFNLAQVTEFQSQIQGHRWIVLQVYKAGFGSGTVHKVAHGVTGIGKRDFKRAWLKAWFQFREWQND